MAGHYYYDPRPYYGLNMSTNLMPLDELFYKSYEPVPYWMDQRMAPMAYPVDYHSGQCVKQVMTRGPELQQLMALPYNVVRPEITSRDDIYADTYKRSPHFSGFGVQYPEMRHPLRGQISQDDTYLHTMMTPQYVNPQNQFPQHVGVGVGYNAMPVPMGNMGNMGSTGGQSYTRQAEELVPMQQHGHTNNVQSFSNQRYNVGGDQQMDVSSKGTVKNSGFNANNGSSNNSSFPNNNGNSSNHSGFNNNSVSNQSGFNNNGSSNIKSYNNDDGYGTNKSSNHSGFNNNGSSNNSGFTNNNGGSNMKNYNNDDGYGTNKSSSRSKTLCNNDDDEYRNIKSSTKSGNVKSKQEMYDDDYCYAGNKTSKKMTCSNDVDNHSTKLSKGNTKQQQRYSNNNDSSSESDEEEYVKTGKKWGTKPLLKHSKENTYSHGSKGYGNDQMVSKKSGKSSSNNSMGVFGSGKKQSQSKSVRYENGWDSSSDDEDESHSYTKKASKADVHRNQVITQQVQQHSHVQSYGQQPKHHSQFYSQMKSVELQVPICCDNCERKVTASLEYVAGVESVLCDQWQKKVTVYGDVKPDVVLKRIRRVKKSSQFWQQVPKRVQPVY